MKSKSFSILPKTLYAILKPIFTVILSLLVFIIASIFLEDYKVYTYPISVILFLIYVYKVFFISTTVYEITTEQLRYTRGVFNIKTDYIELYRVLDFQIDRPLLMRMISVMKITLETSDKSHPRFQLVGIPKSNILDVIRQLVEQNRKSKRVHVIE